MLLDAEMARPCPLCWASASPAAMRRLCIFKPEGFPFDSCNGVPGAKWSQAHLKKPVQSQWNQSFFILYVSPSLQFRDQSPELRNGSLEAKAGA